MAIFRLEAKVFSREKRGRSVVAAAAYRAGTKLKDELKNQIFDYTRRSKGVIDTTILAPENAPHWVHDPARLWNTVEAGEKRKDGQLAREYILALPRELPAEVQFRTALRWTRDHLVKEGMVAEVSLHHPKDGKNPHAHILCTMRRLEGDHFSAKKSREWNDVAVLVKQRETWAEAVNTALADAGRSERVDHRSLRDRQIDRAPEPKIGVKATAMKRRGVEADPRRCEEVRHVKVLNEVRQMMRSIKHDGEVRQSGNGVTWWERSITFVGRIRDRAKTLIKNTWRRLIDGQRRYDERMGPQPER